MRSTHMSKEELRGFINQALRKVCPNVEDVFVFPEEKAAIQSAFPYITTVFNDMDFNEDSPRYIQRVSIIGFVKGKETDLTGLQDDLENKIFRALYKNDFFSCRIVSGSNTNLFRPFGFEGGVFFPYAGIRFEIEVPMIKVLQ